MYKVCDGARSLKWPAKLSAKPFQCECLPSAELAGILMCTYICTDTMYRYNTVNSTLHKLQCYLLKYCTHTHKHTHLFNGPFSWTTRVGRYQKGKTKLDFTEARDSEWQWHQLSHMQVCTLFKTDNYASTSPLSFFIGRMPFLPPNQQRHCTHSA